MDPVTDIALKLIEKGGLYALAGIIVLSYLALGFVITRLFNALNTCQEARIAEGRELFQQTIAVIEANKAAADAATKAANASAEAADRNRESVNDLKTSFEVFARTYQPAARRAQ